MLESDYPYTGRVGPCKYDHEKGIINVESYEQVGVGTNFAATLERVYHDKFSLGRGREANLRAILKKGPVNAAVGARNQVFRFYKEGIVTANDGCTT